MNTTQVIVTLKGVGLRGRAARVSTTRTERGNMSHAGMNHNGMSPQNTSPGTTNHFAMTSSPNGSSAPYDLQFIDTMLAHHQGAIETAREAL